MWLDTGLTGLRKRGDWIRTTFQPGDELYWRRETHELNARRNHQTLRWNNGDDKKSSSCSSESEFFALALTIGNALNLEVKPLERIWWGAKCRFA